VTGRQRDGRAVVLGQRRRLASAVGEVLVAAGLRQRRRRGIGFSLPRRLPYWFAERRLGEMMEQQPKAKRQGKARDERR